MLELAVATLQGIENVARSANGLQHMASDLEKICAETPG